MQDNTEQKDAWNGTVGTSWSQYHDALDAMMQPMTAKLLNAAAARPGERVLDIGCGTGPTSVAFATAVAPNGHVTGVDISALLLNTARGRAAALRLPLDFIEADAATYHFPERFDKIVSRFGVMFFAEPVSALANIRSALAPNGEMIFVCWQGFKDNPWIFNLMSEASKIVPVAPRPKGYAPGPFGFGDRAFLDSVLERAGFTRRTIEGFEPMMRIPGKTTEDFITYYGTVGPFASQMREASDADRVKLQALLADWVGRQSQGGPMMQGAGCWLVRAS